jgi:hypothetical protein
MYILLKLYNTHKQNILLFGTGECLNEAPCATGVGKSALH